MLISLVVAALAVSGVVAVGQTFGPSGSTARAAKPRQATTTTTTTTAPAPTAPPTTAPPAPPALQQPAWANLPEPPGGSVGPGSSGPEVQAYEQRLADLHFDPGPVDGVYDQNTAFAVQTLQKLGASPATGRITSGDVFHLNLFQYPPPLAPTAEPNRTEVDITKQVLTLYQNYQVRVVTTMSSGSGENYCYDTPRDNPTQHVCEDANTPSGRFAYYQFRPGWDKSPLGELYNPFYFNKGIAVHGYQSVPTSPASHGCVRIPMNIAEYFHTLVNVGDAVYVFGGTDAHVTSSTPIGTAPSAPAPAPIPTAPGNTSPPPPS